MLPSISSSARLAAALLLGVSLGACTQDAAPAALAVPTSTTAAAAPLATVPVDSAFTAFNCKSAMVGDALGDPVTGGAERDLVGDATYPAFYRAADASNFYFRLRVSGNPLKTNGVDLSPSSWDILFDTDGNLKTYEYMLTADGNMSGTKVQWVRNTTQDPTNPKDPAETVLQDLSPATSYYDVRATGDGSNFSGNPDYFVTLVIPRTMLGAVGIDTSKPFAVWGGTNAQNYSLNSDFGCYQNMPATLDLAATDPGYLDPQGSPAPANDTVTLPQDTTATTNVLANDTGLANTPITVTVTSGPSHGTTVVNADNTVTYTPTPGYSGADSYTYKVQDAKGQYAYGVVNITVTRTNSPPTANADSATVAEDSSATAIAVLANDSTAPDVGETLTVTAVTQPGSGGSVTLTSGVVRFTPSANFNGTTSFTYTVSDGNGGTATATVNVTVTAVNDAPVANADSLTVAEDSTATIVDVLANDTTGPDTGETLAATAVTQPISGGAVTLSSGVVSFTPAADFSGTTSFTYTLSDGNGGTATGTVTVTVSPVNDAPVARADTFTVAEDAAATVVNVAANDTDVDGDTLSVSAFTAASHGTVTLLSGVLRYQPAANYNGPDAFGYTVSDGKGGTATATVTVTVTAVNDAPVAQDDAATVAEDSGATTIAVLSNDSSAPDTGETLGVTAVTQPANGSVTFTATDVGFTPAPNFNGTTSFTYTVSDGNGGTATATVTVTVTPVDDAPVANDDRFSVDEDSGATALAVLDNDASLDAGETHTVSEVTQPLSGGTVTLTSGVVSFTPAKDFAGTSTFTYTVTDGALTATATATVTVRPVNDAPVAQDDSFTVAEDSPAAALTVTDNDTDVDGNALTVVSASPALHGTVSVQGGVLAYQPDPDFAGTDTFQYTVGDGAGGTASAVVTVTVTEVNDPPVARADAFEVDEDSGANALDVLANDSALPDTGEVLKVLDVTQPSEGGTVTASKSGVSFTPAPDFTGVVTFTYTVGDGNGGTATATVTVNVRPVNDAPVARDDAFTVAEDAAATTVPVLANDDSGPDSGETLTVTAATQPAHGTTTLVSGVVRYQPAADYVGDDAFTYTLSDGNGGTATATVSVTVTAVNDAPVAQDDSATVAEDGSVTMDVLANDTDVEGDALIVESYAQGVNGSVTLSGGKLVYTPPVDFFGTDTFAYTVTDGHGGTATAVVTVTVTDVDDAPRARADAATTTEDTSALVDLLANDDAGPLEGTSVTLVSVTRPAHGTAVVQGTQVLYTPAADFNGTDTFDYTISDGALTATGTVTVTVTETNDAPVANADTATVAEDSGATVIDVLGNDSGGADTGETLSVASVSQPAHGAVVLSGGAVTYAPAADFVGSDSFTYVLSDGRGGTSTGTVRVTVTSVNDEPVASDDGLSVVEDSGATSIDVLGNDSSAPDTGETLMVTGVTQPEHGTVVLSGGGVRYQPAPDFHGTETFAYTIADGNGGSASATVIVTVTSVNDAPVAATDTFSVDQDATDALLPVLGNDRDVDGDALAVTEVTPALHGTVTLTDGVVRYAPAAGYHGPDRFDYTVHDGKDGTATATVTLDVVPPADDDHDGRTNAQELTAGTDPRDADSDDDGVTDGLEPEWNVDSDGDGLVNALDPDSDDDELLDGTELGVTVKPADTDASQGHFVADADPATTTDPLNADTDAGGVADGAEDANHDGRLDAGEIDPLNGADDASRIDSDHDGLSNATELAAGTNPADDDSDDDGVTDGQEKDWSADSDRDGVINALDEDSDNDGLLDGTERGVTTPSADTDVSQGHFVPDADPSTTTDPTLDDTDHGGVLDGAEDVNHNGRVDLGEIDPNVTDDDATVMDSDHDGLTDAQERAAGSNPYDPDSDDDGLPDGDEPDWNVDTDGDGRINVLDTDSDDDGLPDGTEVTLGTRILDPDTDGDGLVDGQEVEVGTNPKDADSDDDGVRDGDERRWGEDTDGDGRINALDADSDGDGLFDGTELGVTVAGPGTDTGAGHFIADADPSTLTDPLKGDTDGGGVLDGAEDVNHNGRVDEGEADPAALHDDARATVDPCDARASGQPDQDRDGLADACDRDADGDGFVDGVGLSGGGCSATGGEASLFALAAVGLALARRRRRAQGPLVPGSRGGRTGRSRGGERSFRVDRGRRSRRVMASRT